MAARGADPVQPILLVTRPAGSAARFLAALGRDIPAVISPLLDIVPLATPPITAPVAALILTSEHAATVAAGMGFPAGLTAYVVGPQTARAARAAGFGPISADGDAETLVSLILHHRPTGPLLHLHGEHTRGDIARRLHDAGLTCLEQTVYRQVELPLSDAAKAALAGPLPVLAPLFSPRTAAILADQGPFLAPLHVIAISPAILDPIAPLSPATVTVAERPDSAAMVAATLSRLRALVADPSA
jgi:uroporphyrinogen-III synthase